LKEQKFTEKDGKYVSCFIFMRNYIELAIWEEKGEIKGTMSDPEITRSCFCRKL
jgi:hypothetical protein